MKRGKGFRKNMQKKRMRYVTLVKCDKVVRDIMVAKTKTLLSYFQLNTFYNLHCRLKRLRSLPLGYAIAYHSNSQLSHLSCKQTGQ